VYAVHAYLFKADSSDDLAEPRAAPDPTFDWDQANGAIWREIALHFVDVEERRPRQGPAWGRREVARYGYAEYGFCPAMCRELLRVGRALLLLPRIDQALVDGFLVWADIVVLTRVAVPRTEAAWLETALKLPLDQLELLAARSVRGWAPPNGDDPPASEPARAPRPSTAPRPTRWSHPVAPRLAFVRPLLRPALGTSSGMTRLQDAPDVRHPSRAPPPSG
jgi:hypothetical protein